MGTLSIWQLLIGIVFFALFYAVPIFAANSEKRLSRAPYALRTVTGLAVFFVAGLAADIFGQAFALLLIAASLVYVVFLVLWSVHRVQHIGWSKWWCLLMAIPIVNLVFWLVLLFVPGQPGSDPVPA